MWFKSSFTIPAVAAISFCLIGGTSPAAADILHVPGDFTTIQAAIDAAMDGDEVEVHPGTYNESINLLGKAVTLRSSDGPDVTTIDATGLNDSVVKCITGEGPNTVLQGFTITGGLAVRGGGMRNQVSSPTVQHCVFLRNAAEAPPFINSQGGGMYNFNSNPMVSNCVFRENTSLATAFAFSQGGGMFNRNSHPTVSDCLFIENVLFFSLDTPSQGAGMCNIDSDPIVIDCQFIGNRTGTHFLGNEGGGMFNDGSSPTVTNCTFEGNVADLGVGGGMANAFDSNPTVTDCTFVANHAPIGTGMDNAGSSPTVTDCLFSENVGGIGGGMSNCAFSHPIVSGCTFSGNLAGGPDTGAGRGGGMRNNASSPTVINCVFEGNVAYGTEQWGGGGGMFNNYLASPTVTNCTFVNNEAGATGGAIYNFQGGSPTLINCSLIGNTAGQSGGVMYNTNTSFFESSPSMANCILWGNSHDQVFDGKNATTTITYSDVEQGWTGDGGNNINADPMFVDPGIGDHRLSSDSPCIDAGDNTAVPKGIDTDLDGNPRFVDDLGTPDTGNADCVNPIVDMGAYEFLPFPSPPGDLNGDGVVGIIDLLILLASWGDCPALPEQCSADLNYDCVVGITDLLTLLANWG